MMICTCQNLESDKALLWVAREGLKAPLPRGWTPRLSDAGEAYYYDHSNGKRLEFLFSHAHVHAFYCSGLQRVESLARGAL